MATEKVIKIVIDKKGADKSVKGLGEDVKGVDKSTNKLTGTLDKMSGGAVSAFTAMKGGLRSAVTGFKSLRVAIIGTGIGALIIGILAVKEAFTSSEEGQNKFAKILGVIGSITGNLSDLLSNLGMKIISVFENPKQALKDFGNLIKDQIVNRFIGVLEFIPKIGTAIKQVFSGDFTEASKTATDALGKVAFGVESIVDNTIKATEAFKDFTKEVVKDAEIAGKIADQRAKADKVERNLIVERAKANRDIAELRFKSEERNKFSALERVEFLKQASKIQDEITDKEIYSAQLRLQAKQSENALANSTKADLDEEAQLKAKLVNLETQRLNANKRLQTQIVSFGKEAKAKADAEAKLIQDKLDAEEKLRIEQVEKEAKNEAERLQKIADIQDEFTKKREDELAETELQKIELEKERKLKELEDLEATEQQKADIIKFYNDKINNQKINNEKKLADDEKQLAQDVSDAKASIANSTANLLIELAGRQSKLGKAIAVANTIRSGIEGVQNAYTTAQKSPITALFPAYPLTQAGLAGAFSALQVKQILSSSDTASSGGSQGGGETSAPSFNLVQGTPQNQLAESLGGVANRPVETYVVASNVTTAQSLNRNKLDEGSI